MKISRSSRTFAVVILAWTVLCGAIFFIAGQLDTPVRSAGFGHREAEAMAMAVLIGRDAKTYGDYIVINSARSDVGSADGRERWVVLCNRSAGGSPETAIVVELERSGRDVLGFRRPGEKILEPSLP